MSVSYISPVSGYTYRLSVRFIPRGRQGFDAQGRINGITVLSERWGRYASHDDAKNQTLKDLQFFLDGKCWKGVYSTFPEIQEKL